MEQELKHHARVVIEESEITLRTLRIQFLVLEDKPSNSLAYHGVSRSRYRQMAGISGQTLYGPSQTRCLRVLQIGPPKHMSTSF